MNGKVSIDHAGRVVIPKRAREALGIGPGDTLDMTFDADGLTLRPERHTVALQKERGVWVFRSGIALSRDEANEALDLMRSKRTSGQD
jgi:AbrB family looped-hinge helix DNA binding protein